MGREKEGGKRTGWKTASPHSSVEDEKEERRSLINGLRITSNLRTEIFTSMLHCRQTCICIQLSESHIQTCIHTYIHTDIHTDIHADRHTYIQKYIHVLHA